MRLLFTFAFILALEPCCLQAQTPALSQAAGKVGISSNQNGNASNFEFYMDPAGYPRAVTQGETVFMMGSWPSGNTPAMSDDQHNTWAGATSCTDSQSTTHGFFYAINAASGTSVITESHGSAVHNGVFDWAHFYNMSTTPSGFVDGSSCKTGVTPANNAAPNIQGNSYDIGTSGDLILTCVYVEQGSLGAPNPISSISWPSGSTGLSDDMTYGHACAYGISTAGSFTPSFTVAQSAHNTFTIMSAAFKGGSGGTTPGNGASVVLSEMLYNPASGQTIPIYLPCPTNSSAVVIGDDSGDITNIVDGSNTWTRVESPGNYYGPFYYVNSPTINDANSYKISVSFRNSGNYSLSALYCLVGTNGIDLGVTTQNGATLNGPGSTYNGACSTSGGVCGHISSLGISTPGDLIFDSGAFGQGPADSCVTGKCVFDFVGSTSWSVGDNQSYSNGDVAAHYYALAAGTVSFDFNVASGVTGGSALSLAFLQSSVSSVPVPPTGLAAVVH